MRMSSLALPAVHGESQNDISMAAHGLVNGNGGTVAGATDVAVQALKLHMCNAIATVLIKAGIPQYVS